MKNGILIYAHNSKSLDYALMSLISAGLAKKNLKVPVSVITDTSTVEWMKISGIQKRCKDIFENIIIVDRPDANNNRRLYDGTTDEVVSFINSNRCTAWDLTPYDRTLLIDSDFLIFSNKLSQYWNVDIDLMIGNSINDIYSETRLGYHDKFVSDVGVKLYWATTVMFTKNQNTRLFFELVNTIKNNYQYFADTFRFDERQYRNDISFSLAKHILNGFEESQLGDLPPILTSLDKDILFDVKSDNLQLLITPRLDSNYCLASVSGVDIHIMNKQSIVRNKDKLLKLI